MATGYYYVLTLFILFSLFIAIKTTYNYLKKGKSRSFRCYSVDTLYSFKKEPLKAYFTLLSNCLFIGLALILLISMILVFVNRIDSSMSVTKEIPLVFVDFIVTLIISLFFIASATFFYEQYIQKSKIKPVSKAIFSIFPWLIKEREDSEIFWFPYDIIVVLLLFFLFVYYITRILV
jgi:uncharacterized membrane protein (DUF485 family)